jgi:hypothetical protein
MRYKVYIVYKITDEFTVRLVLKYTSIMITKTIVTYSMDQTKSHTWNPLAQCSSELDKVKHAVHSRAEIGHNGKPFCTFHVSS